MLDCIAYIIIGTSMLPTVEPGDTLVACPQDTIHRGDIVIADLGRKHPLAKRVVGVPGDSVTVTLPDWGKHKVVPKKHYCIKSDNPNNHFDSRRFGLIDQRRIQGVVIQHRRRGR